MNTLVHWLHIAAFVFMVIGITIILLALGAALEAYLDFKKRPSEPMMWCNRHGAFRKVHALPLFPELGGNAENSFVCPSCYYEIVFKDPNSKLKVS